MAWGIDLACLCPNPGPQPHAETVYFSGRLPDQRAYIAAPITCCFVEHVVTGSYLKIWVWGGGLTVDGVISYCFAEFGIIAAG